MDTPLLSFKRHRFPPAIINHAVWLYCRFNLSLREVEEMFLQRGVDVSYETIRRWVTKFGPPIARGLRRRQPRPGDIWHLDEVVVKINGRKYWLWRAVDQDGLVLDEVLQSKRNTQAAKRLLRRLMKQHGLAPKRIITDKLRSYGAAKREIVPGVEHRSHKGLNNRAENSHLPFRKRERAMQSYRSTGSLQRFVSIHSAIRNCFSVPTRRRSALTIRYHRLEAFDAWNVASTTAREPENGAVFCDQL
jgi:putative transposase